MATHVGYSAFLQLPDGSRLPISSVAFSTPPDPTAVIESIDLECDSQIQASFLGSHVSIDAGGLGMLTGLMITSLQSSLSRSFVTVHRAYRPTLAAREAPEARELSIAELAEHLLASVGPLPPAKFNAEGGFSAAP